MSKELERVVFVPVIHTDVDSVENARSIVLKTAPDVVAVELDRTRYQQLLNPQTDEMIPAAATGDSIADLMNQIAGLEKSLGQMTGSMAGDEMLAAIEAGREVNAKIALIDRPIEITAQALMQVPLSEIYKLTEMIPDAANEVKEGGSGDLMDLLRDADNVDSLMIEFKKEFPMLSSVLIDQRDYYIARAIKSILSDVEGKIVVVLGSGHIEGVTKTLRALLENDVAS
ncbi:MAG: TraB domain-containing protein [Candidatus Thorarchaeota archaeon]